MAPPTVLLKGVIQSEKMLKRVSYGLRNVEVHWRKMLLGFVPSRSYFHTIRQGASAILTDYQVSNIIP